VASGVRRLEGGRLAALVAAFAASMAYSLFLAGATQGIPTIWTANAVVAVGLLTLSWRNGMALLAIASAIHVAFQLAVGDPPVFIGIVTALDGAHAVAMALLLRAVGCRGRLRDMRALIVTILTATAFTAAWSVVTNGCLELAAGHSFWNGWLDWAIPNTLGAAIALPIGLVLLDRRHAEGFPAGRLEIAGYVVAMAAISALLYSVSVPIRVLLLAPMLFAVFRGGPQAIALLIVASLAAAIPAILHRTGLDGELARNALRSAQASHLALYLTGMMGGLALGRQARLQALLVRRTAAARAAQARAQAANQAKSDFLATMSHEIRTPLNSILGFTALVADDASLSDENRRRLELVTRAGQSLAELINDLLDFSKVEAGRLELNLGPVSPAAVLRDAAAIVAPTAQGKGLALDVTVTAGGAEPDAAFALDEARLRQVLLNLLANAVKFTAQGVVSARLILGPDRGALRFEIADTGIGIAPDVQARLFERFSQADSSISRSFGGTGLGLAISRALVRQMGGEIGVQSELGQGARFWINLVAEPALVAHQPDVAEAPVEAAAARVLLVDDHPMNRELGQALLTLAGCDVVTAEDGVQAVEAARAGGFDVILMDVHMPVMDGLAATRAIRGFGGAVGAVPIVALTADVPADQVARCREAGMTDHVAKPINRDQLLAAVGRALETVVLPDAEARARA